MWKTLSNLKGTYRSRATNLDSKQTIPAIQEYWTLTKKLLVKNKNVRQQKTNVETFSMIRGDNKNIVKIK